jgi:hypothetical protein
MKINESKKVLSCGKVLLGQPVTQTLEDPSKATKQQKKYKQNASLIKEIRPHRNGSEGIW